MNFPLHSFRSPSNCRRCPARTISTRGAGFNAADRPMCLSLIGGMIRLVKFPTMGCFHFARKRGSSLALLLIIGATFSSIAAQSQTLRIKLVDGRNGKPIANSCVNVWVEKTQKEALAIPTDENGIAQLRLTNDDGEIDSHNRWEPCDIFGVVDPVTKYSESFRVNAGYASCEPQHSNYSWLSIQSFSTRDVLRDGLVTANTCGRLKQ